MLQNTSLVQIHLFYPMLFLAFIVLTVTIGLVIKGKSSDNTYTKVFAKSNDNAKDITIKVTTDMKNMHNEIVEHALPLEYEQELNSLEVMVHEIKDKLDLLLERVIRLENERK